MSNNVKLQVLLRAVDQASRPFKSIRTASKSLSGDIRETQKSLRELNGHALKRRTKNAKTFHDKCENFNFRASNETAALTAVFLFITWGHFGYG